MRVMRLDATALEQLFRAQGPGLLVFAARRTFDAELALDVVGETFAIAFEKRATFRGASDGEAIGWLQAICRTVISHHYRRSDVERRALRRMGVELPAMEDEERRRIEELAGLSTLHQRVAGALEHLPPGQRDAIRLRIVEERSYPELAAHLGVTQETARARVSRGLRALAHQLDDAEERADAH